MCHGAARADRCASARALSALRERVVCGREVSPVWRVVSHCFSLSRVFEEYRDTRERSEESLEREYVGCFKNLVLYVKLFSTVGSGNVRCTYNLASSLGRYR